MSIKEIQERQPGLLRAAFFGLCPQCGARTLFADIARFAPKCESCGLDFSSYNVGDGPAAFLTMGVGAIVIVLAILLDIAARPPFWVHLIIWVPFTAILVTISLRMTKAILLTIEHRRNARESVNKDIT